MNDRNDTAARRSGWNFDHGRMKALAVGIATTGIAAAIIVLAGTEPAYACLLPGIPC